MDDEIVETITEETETIDGKTYPITVIRRQRRDKKPFFFTCRGQEKWWMPSPSPMQESAALPLYTPYIRTTQRKSAARAASGSRRPSPGSWNKTASGDVPPKKNCLPDRFQSGGQPEKRVAMEANGVPAKVLYPCPVQGVNTRFLGR